ncbi:hypothetical protein BDZ97DRAFT_1764478 [Flammula alnicola]|nr:hypothetical protein BDZ97DRAFT_1764478 [Flammula alnicola]
MAKGRSATRFPLTPEQIKHIDTYLPAFEKEVFRCDPNFDGHSRELTKWKEEKAKEIMADPLFDYLPSLPDGESLPEWIKTVQRRFSNHYSNYMVRKFKKASTSTSSGSDSAAIEKRLDDLLRCAVVTFLGDLSPREMFASENEELIKTKMKELSEAHPNLVGGGLRNKALAILWDSDDVDCSVWERKIEDLANDIQTNQAHFPHLIARALQNLCNRKRLGSTYMSFSYAVRDINDGIEGATIYVGYDCLKDMVLAPKLPDHNERVAAWLEHADAVLPRKPTRNKLKFPPNKDGIPILPQVDLVAASLSQLIELLQGFLTAVWNYSWPADHGMPSIPWDLLTANPNDFYNSETFKIPVPLKSPELYTTDPADVYLLLKYFLSLSQPFQFRPKDDIQERTLTREHEQQKDRTAGEDADVEDIVSNEPLNRAGGSGNSNTRSPVNHNRIIHQSVTTTVKKKKASKRKADSTPAIDNLTSDAVATQSQSDITSTASQPPLHVHPGPSDNSSHNADATSTSTTTPETNVVAHSSNTVTSKPLIDHTAAPLQESPSQHPSDSNAKKARGRPRKAADKLAPSGIDVNSATVRMPEVQAVANTRKSARKRKEPDTPTAESGPQCAQSAKKKRKGTFLWTDDHGNFFDNDGNPVDSHGNPLRTAE